MKKWIFITLLIGIVLIWQLLSIYIEAFDDQKSSQKQAIEIAQHKLNLTSIEMIDYYHGNEAYYVIIGQDKNNESWITWIQQEKMEKKDPLVINMKNGWTREQVRQHVLTERDPINIKDIRLGLDKGKPLWEVTYIDQEKRFTYYYLDFESGSFLKRYSLKHKQLKGEF